MYLLYIGTQQKNTVPLVFKIMVILNSSDSETEMLLSELLNLNNNNTSFCISSATPTMHYKDYYYYDLI